ncbi:MAG: GNAT family N-acetyltransferase [Actinomycetota bacterium]|nr:GNAT family N-acetyltransferase [Actinomycetota bacterium]
MLSALLDPLGDPRWAQLVAESPQASIFHHPAWLELLHRRYRYPLAAAVVLDGAGQPMAGLPMALVSSRLTGRRLVCLPFSDVCPPLVTGDNSEALELLAETVERERRTRDIPLHVRAPFPQLEPPVDRYLRHLVELGEGAEATEAHFASSARRHVRKAERLGVEIEHRSDGDALEIFYALHLYTRRRLGVPTQPKAFIRDLAGLFNRGLGFVAVARFEQRPIAAAVFLRSGGTLTYKYGASDQRHLHARPNNLLFARVIRWGCEHGLQTLDLGRTDPGQEGLAAFKRSWGATEETLAYTYRGTRPPPASSHLERAAGAVIRRTPPAVGRAMGELLYRHTG